MEADVTDLTDWESVFSVKMFYPASNKLWFRYFMESIALIDPFVSIEFRSFVEFNSCYRLHSHDMQQKGSEKETERNARNPYTNSKRKLLKVITVY